MGAVAVEIPEWFRHQMRRLIGLQFVPNDLITHWEALRMFDEKNIAYAVTRIGAQCTKFPAPWVFGSFAEQDRARDLARTDIDRSVDLDHPRLIGELPTGAKLYQRREWRYYCEECLDMGTRSRWCGNEDGAQPWEERQHCGRRKDHEAHRYDVPCPCADSNPDVQRKREIARHVGRRSGEE